jgi:GNAT superfamily N-acetyltransferase
MPQTPVDIRQATVVDARAIAEVHVASWQSAYAGMMPALFLVGLSVEERARSWRDAIQRGRIHVALAHAGDGLAGWVAYGKCRDTDKDESWGEIEAIYLHPSRYGQQIGALLLKHAQRSLRELGFGSVSLWVLANNARARTFYERVGFSTDEKAKAFELGGAVLSEVRYERSMDLVD